MRELVARYWYPLLGAVVVTVLVGFLGFTSLSAWEGSCTACHATSVSGLAEGGHATIECRACHSDTGVVDVIDFRLRLAAMVPATLGAPYPSLPTVTSARCLACHESILEGVVVSAGIRMSHSALHRAGYQCTDCHASLIHGDERMPGVSMDECLRCHVVSALSQDCRTCHDGPVRREARLRSGSFALVHGAEWQSSHGAGDLSTCSACHTAARCESCHGVALPHPDRWLNEHGAASQASECESCHATQFCADCHGMPIPHPAGFLASHSTDVETTGVEACHYCHESGSCDACHVAHTHPGLDPERVRRLRDKAGLDVD